MTATATEITSVAVTVTGDHIAMGEPLATRGCPIALAFYDAIPGAYNVAVFGGPVTGPASAAIHLGDGYKLQLALPAEAKAFILAFDDLRDVEPFTFTAEVTR